MRVLRGGMVALEKQDPTVGVIIPNGPRFTCLSSPRLATSALPPPPVHSRHNEHHVKNNKSKDEIGPTINHS